MIVSEMQQERLREKCGAELSGPNCDRAMSIMGWNGSHMELNIASNVKNLGLLQTGQ